MKKVLFAIAFTLSALPGLSFAQPADPTTDALTSCITRSVTNEDSVTTARWLFIAMSRHPSLPQTSRVNDVDGLAANRQMGALVNEIIFNRCNNETRAAVQTFGQQAALNIVFGALGEKAMVDLMGNRDVLASVVQLGAYVDIERLNTMQ